MKDAAQILRFVLSRMEHIYGRPLMFGGDGDGVDLVLWHYHLIWAEIVERSEELDRVRDRTHADLECGSRDFASHYREEIRGGDTTEIEVARFVVSRWRAIDGVMGIATEEALSEEERAFYRLNVGGAMG